LVATVIYSLFWCHLSWDTDNRWTECAVDQWACWHSHLLVK